MKEVVERVVERTGLSRSSAEPTLKTGFAAIAESIGRGEKARPWGFGTFEAMAARAARLAFREGGADGGGGRQEGATSRGKRRAAAAEGGIVKTAAGLCVVAVLLCSGAGAQVDVDNRRLRIDPSAPGTPEYDQSIEERNRRAREAAEREGRTHIDTTYGEFGDAADRPTDRVPEKPAGEAPAAKRPIQAARPETNREEPAGGGYERAEEVGQGELRKLVGELLQALDRQPQVVRLRAERRRERPEEGRQEPPPTQRLPAIAPPEVAAGSGLYARMLYGVNSDYRGPVLIEVLEPPLAGAVLSGGFERVRDRLVLRLNRLSWRGRDTVVEAWAVGLDCACYGVGGEVDRHWWERLVLPAAVRFAEGYLTAKGSGGRRVEVSGETVVDERDSPTGKQAIYTGLGNATRTFGDILLEDAPRGPTVRIPRDTEIAVVFARPPGERASDVRSAAPAPRGPTADGVIRAEARPAPGEGAGETPDAPPAGRRE